MKAVTTSFFQIIEFCVCLRALIVAAALIYVSRAVARAKALVVRPPQPGHSSQGDLLIHSLVDHCGKGEGTELEITTGSDNKQIKTVVQEN